MRLPFTKMNGAGNDFVMVDNRDLRFSLSQEQIARACDRHRGIGADGLLAVEPSTQNGSSLKMRYYNSDGGEAEMCGNGARCFARFAATLSSSPLSSLSFETMAGTIRAELFPDGSVELQMSDPHSYSPAQPTAFLDRSRDVAFLNTGVPHAVVFTGDSEELSSLSVREEGRALRFHERFAPQGTNVNFVCEEKPGNIAIRTYERGVEDETLACGTGVVASALLYHLRSGAPSPISVRVRGGDTLTVRFSASTETAHRFTPVFLRGPADIVFTGEIDL